MFNSKIDLFSQRWIDTVFDEKNKEYGAYELRSNESKMTVKAVVIGAALFISLISLPVILTKVESTLGRKEKNKVIDQQITMVDLLPPPEEAKELKNLPPPPPRLMKSIKEVKKFTPPVVAPEEDVVEELVTQDELVEADAGAQNVDASEDGEIVIDETPAEITTEQTIIEEQTYIFQAVEVPPEFPGGSIGKFTQYVVDELGYIEIEVPMLRIIIQFVIEKDGRIAEIQVLRDGGYPDIAQRVVRVLQKAPKGKPGVNNGRSVRVAYTLPITITME
ncbi:MAG: energy transducer TonB [Prevotellaceae bacterium]|jgi:protein TonB|nr:energy transducer TonB [Prevotellaceae bacterium]